MSQTVKKQKWIKRRHRIITKVLRVFLRPYCILKYNIKIHDFKEQENRPYLILLNHQTPFDQFFVGVAFKGPVYYMATEDIFSLGWVSSLIKFLVAPIPIKKQTTDVRAVMNCIRVGKEGGTIAIAPEGNRTYSGRTEYMNPSIVPLVRKLNMPIALFRIEGGYGAQPRWSDVVRKGKMQAYVSRIIKPEEYEALSDEELFSAISEGLYVDEAVADYEFHHKHLAEYLERAVYVCPYCGLSTFESNHDTVECKKCGRRIKYLPSKELQGVGFDFPFPFVAQWYEYQKDFVNNLDLTEMTSEPLYRESGQLSEVLLYKSKNVLHEKTDIFLYGDRIVIKAPDGSEYNLPFSEITAASVLGRNKANIYFKDHVYQISGGKRFNALKYVNIFYRYKNISKGDNHGKFLGL